MHSPHHNDGAITIAVHLSPYGLFIESPYERDNFMGDERRGKVMGIGVIKGDGGLANGELGRFEKKMI